MKTPKFTLKRLQKLQKELSNFGTYLYATNSKEWNDHKYEVSGVNRLLFVSMDRITPTSPVYDEEFVFHQT